MLRFTSYSPAARKQALQLHLHCPGGGLGFFTGIGDGLTTRDGDAHAAFAFDLRFAEKTELGVGASEGFV